MAATDPSRLASLPPEQTDSNPSPLQEALKAVEATMGPDSPAARQIRQQLAAGSTGPAKAGDIDPVSGRPYYEVQRVDGNGVFLVS